MRIGWARVSSEWQQTSAVLLMHYSTNRSKDSPTLTQADFNPVHADEDDDVD